MLWANRFPTGWIEGWIKVPQNRLAWPPESGDNRDKAFSLVIRVIHILAVKGLILGTSDAMTDEAQGITFAFLAIMTLSR